ncbi:hypothetical protein SADUNF_Sadunf04G0112000 [Salix dunnii]|uniref:Uncharacterized protein n=1 Tax=Salix dunnii TaxID=1413687 RepID=A0A835K535_9ROSI|nr:hypothetical protein SADUNF_Sadunf04G0112000 [Salix dunnii]
MGVHVGVGPSTRNHKSIFATKSIEDIPPENLASDEDMEEEESSSCGSSSCSMIPLNWARMMTQSASYLQPMVLLPLLLLQLQLRILQGVILVAREEQVAETVVRVGGATLDFELLTSGVAAASVDRDELEFDSFPSDPMCAKVAAVVREWEIIKNKKQRNKNVKQAATMGNGSAVVGLTLPHVSGVYKAINLELDGGEGFGCYTWIPREQIQNLESRLHHSLSCI